VSRPRRRCAVCLAPRSFTPHACTCGAAVHLRCLHRHRCEARDRRPALIFAVVDVWMRSTLHRDAVVYEVLVGEVLVWRRLIEIRKRNLTERRAIAREQERVAFHLAAQDDPIEAAKHLTGPGPIAGLIGRT